jgi:nitroreductase
MKKLITVLVWVIGISVLGMSAPAPAQPQNPADGKSGIAPSDRAAVDHILTTTRSVRKRLDLTRPVEPEVIEQAIAIAMQAPTGSNLQNWHFIVLTDPEKKKAIADLYRKGADMYRSRPRPDYGADDPRTKQRERMSESGAHLYKHLHEVPVLVIACIEGRVETQPQFMQASTYGSILPSAWSLMLALRSRGVGSAWTTLHLIHEKEAAQALGIPENITQAVLIPVAYYTGTDFQPAKRLPARERTHWNSWGQQRQATSAPPPDAVKTEK